MKNKAPIFVYLIIVILLTGFRITSYHDANLSISTQDSGSYVGTAKQLQSAGLEIFSANRSFTYPFVLWIMGQPDKYQILPISEPALSDTNKTLGLQPGFDRVVVLQLIIAILCWNYLAFVVYRKFNNPWLGCIAAFFVLAFAFSPQLADWDRVVMTESISFSLYALEIGLLIEMAFIFSDNRYRNKIILFGIIGIWTIITFFWVLTRDTNAYFLIVLPVFIGGILFWKKARSVVYLPAAIACVVYLLLLFALQQFTFQRSHRWLLPTVNNITMNVLPYPARVTFFEKRGMPIDPKLLSIKGSMEYSGIKENKPFMNWVQEKGLTTYTSFLVHNPRWAINSFIDNLEVGFSQNIQPYYLAQSRQIPKWVLPYGNILHSKSETGILVCFILLTGMIAMGSHDRKEITWIWLLIFLFVSSMALIFFGYIGEVRSIHRHMLGGVVPIRLLMWIILLKTIDRLILKKQI